ncbi:MAG: VIT and VWA domain-containing protein [Polyangiaceae bacterium]
MSFFRTHLAALFALVFVCACSGAQPATGPWPMPGDAPPSDETPSEEADPALLSGAEMGTPAAAWRDVLTDPGEVPQLRVAADDDKALPLQHTSVKATLAGLTASVEVTQRYTNPYKTPIEATYIFPLPENSAVHAMKMKIGDRTIEAVVKERAAARATYDAARSAGHTAALLEQERPNVFTESVANIEPGKGIDVVVQYVQDLSYDAGQYEFVFPMVVGPRYIPGNALGTPASGTGTYADTDAVPDASRITPRYVGQGQRSGQDISIDLVASGNGAVSRFDVPTHDVKVESLADGSMHLTLADKKEIPNRDFVLRYRVAEPKPVATLFASGKGEGAFSLVIQPPSLDVDALVGKREFVFVVDVSGSMHGIPLGLCKSAMRSALAGMRPVDTFNVITFSGSTGHLWAEPHRATEGAILQALQFIDNLGAGGGTEMMKAVEEALSFDVRGGRNRYVFFMTDGEVGNDEQILGRTGEFVSALEKKGVHARVFGFGVGSSVNRSLLQGLGERGRGLTVYATNTEDPSKAVNRFYRYVDRGVLSKLRVDWGSLGANEVYPSALPDLFASHPIIVHGRYKGSLAGPVTVHATSSAGEVEIPVKIARAPADDGWPVQELLWARSKIGSLEADMWGGRDAARAAQDIRDLGISHHLITAYTSFVAVDSTRVVSDGKPKRVIQALEVPEGVDPAAAGARSEECLTCFSKSHVAPSNDPLDARGGQEAQGYEFSEDPLNAGGFGPSDASIRVRGGPGESVAASAPDHNRVGMMATEEESLRVEPGARGCYCGVVGARGGDDGPLSGSRAAWLFLAALAIFAGRRRLR